MILSPIPRYSVLYSYVIASTVLASSPTGDCSSMMHRITQNDRDYIAETATASVVIDPGKFSVVVHTTATLVGLAVFLTGDNAPIF